MGMQRGDHEETAPFCKKVAGNRQFAGNSRYNFIDTRFIDPPPLRGALVRGRKLRGGSGSRKPNRNGPERGTYHLNCHRAPASRINAIKDDYTFPFGGTNGSRDPPSPI